MMNSRISDWKGKNYAENGFQEKAEYAEMRKNYFAYIDHNNCERTYEYIKSQGF